MSSNTFPYNRIIQWVAGPVSILAGFVATVLVKNVAGLSLYHDAIANAVIGVGTFLVGAAVTYAAHHKWLDNVVKDVVQVVDPSGK